MRNGFRIPSLSCIAFGLAAGPALAQQDNALASWYAQQATQVRALVEQLGSSDTDRQKFALWQLELELAVPDGMAMQPMLEEAAAAGVLPALERLASARDADDSATAAKLHAHLIDALGLSRPPTRTTRILNGIVSESIEPDADGAWLALDLEAGKEYRVRAADCGLVSALVVDPDSLAIIDGGFAVNRSISFTSDSDRPVLMRVRPSHCEWTRTVNVSSGAPIRSLAASATAKEAMPVTEGRFLGHLAENDRQWVSMQLTDGQSIEIVADPGDSGLDTFLTVFDATRRTRLADDDDGGTGLGSRLVYTSDSNAEILIEISRLGSNAGEYELTIADILPPSERGNPAELGVAYTGNLTDGPREWWRFSPEANLRYRVDASPMDGLDTYIKVYEIDGQTLIGEDDDGGDGLGSRLDFSSPTDSPVLIEVSSFNGNPGTYRLMLSERPNPEHIADAAERGGVYRGFVREGDERWWRIETRAGESYDFEAYPLDDLDTIMDLIAADGVSQIDHDDDGGQGLGSRIRYRAQTGGPVFILVSGLNGSVGEFEFSVR